MTQYILNSAAIWLLSLLVFDLFLRKETYHSYNRFYLIGTLLLGIFLPLWQWKDNAVIYGNGFSKPIQGALNIKQTITEQTAMPASAINWESYLTYIYLAGVAISIMILVVELIKLIVLYNKGCVVKEGAWTVIETGKKHSPFSIFNYVFVESKEQYTTEQWNIILTHEQLHSMAFHFIDLLLILALRIVFWFQPLVYLYQRRLLLLHEYQADIVSAAQPKVYCQFLIEQSLLQTAPAISHSFNYSPIKSRILMLTKKSSPLKKSKLLLALPLTLVCLLLFTNNSFSAKFDKKGNVVKYKGNTIELSPFICDTIKTINPQTGKTEISIVRNSPIPLKLNGEKIYNSYDTSIKMKYQETPDFVNSRYTEGIMAYLLDNLKSEIAKLDDGGYWLGVNNVVLNKNGAIVYYEYNGIETASDTILSSELPRVKKVAVEEFGKKIGPLLDNYPSRNPPHLNKTGVPFLINAAQFLNIFTVKNHKLAGI